MKLVLNLCCILILGLSAKAAEDVRYNQSMNEIKKTFGMVPTFFKEYPASGLPGAWEEFKAVQLNPKTAIDGKTKELIGLAVAAQIPCRYCTAFHKRAIRFDGGTKAEMNMAIAVAATARKWSAYFNGAQLDMGIFKADVDTMVTNMKKGEAARKESIEVTDMKTASQDIESTLGFTPRFLKAYPEAALPGAWMEVKNIVMSPNVIPAKDKSLISLAVSSQVPCNYCVYIDTEMAKANGASTAEIQEAIAMAGIVRHWSTVLNGIQQDEKAFLREVDSMFKHLEKSRSQEKTKIGSLTH